MIEITNQQDLTHLWDARRQIDRHNKSIKIALPLTAARKEMGEDENEKAKRKEEKTKELRDAYVMARLKWYFMVDCGMRMKSLRVTDNGVSMELVWG